MDIVVTVVFGIFMAMFAAIGCFAAAYHLLSKVVDDKLSDRDQSINRLTAQDGEHSRSLQREMVSRLQKDNEHREARDRLHLRISLLETEFRRWRDGGQNE